MLKTDSFRLNVRQFCRLRGMTQADLAQKAGLSREWLCTMLSRKANPSLLTCERIAKALETSLEALLVEPVAGAVEEKIAERDKIGVD